MERVFTLEEWEKKREARYEVARKIGFVQRSPLQHQLGKSSVKKAALEKLYGQYGQPISRTTPEA